MREQGARQAFALPSPSFLGLLPIGEGNDGNQERRHNGGEIPPS